MRWFSSPSRLADAEGGSGGAHSPIGVVWLRRRSALPFRGTDCLSESGPEPIRELLGPSSGPLTGDREADNLGLDKSPPQGDCFIQKDESIRQIGRSDASSLLLTPRPRQNQVQGQRGVRCLGCRIRPGAAYPGAETSTPTRR